MKSENLEEIMKMFELSEEKHKKTGEEIQRIILYGKYPVEKPTITINIAPPASGKTGLNGVALRTCENNNAVIINSDELKPFHPNVEEIAKKYPQFYTKITDQASNTWTSDLFDRALKEKYNIIFEGTGRNARILETIKAKMQGYNVIVRGMAVSDMNCLISILGRYASQVETKGWGRLVTLEHFYETYKEMPNTIAKIEESGIVNSVQIYKRGESPNNPQEIYNSENNQYNRYYSSKAAVLSGRDEDKKEVIKSYDEKMEIIEELMGKINNSEEVEKILLKIKEQYSLATKGNEK